MPLSDENALAIIAILANRLGEIRIGREEIMASIDGRYEIETYRDISREELVIIPKGKPMPPWKDKPSKNLASRYDAIAAEMEEDD